MILRKVAAWQWSVCGYHMMLWINKFSPTGVYLKVGADGLYETRGLALTCCWCQGYLCQFWFWFLVFRQPSWKGTRGRWEVHEFDGVIDREQSRVSSGNLRTLFGETDDSLFQTCYWIFLIRHLWLRFRVTMLNAVTVRLKTAAPQIFGAWWMNGWSV